METHPEALLSTPTVIEDPVNSKGMNNSGPDLAPASSCLVLCFCSLDSSVAGFLSALVSPQKVSQPRAVSSRLRALSRKETKVGAALRAGQAGILRGEGPASLSPEPGTHKPL